MIFSLSLSTVSGDVSQDATVRRESCCLLMAQSVWREKTVHAWTSALDAGWNQERPLKPMMDVTTGQNNTQRAPIVYACTSYLHFTEKYRKTFMFDFLGFSICEGGRLNCTRYPCPGKTSFKSLC